MVQVRTSLPSRRYAGGKLRTAVNVACFTHQSVPQACRLLPQRNKQLESELDVRARELHASKSAIMQLLEQVQGAKDRWGPRRCRVHKTPCFAHQIDSIRRFPDSDEVTMLCAAAATSRRCSCRGCRPCCGGAQTARPPFWCAALCRWLVVFVACGGVH